MTENGNSISQMFISVSGMTLRLWSAAAASAVWFELSTDAHANPSPSNFWRSKVGRVKRPVRQSSGSCGGWTTATSSTWPRCSRRSIASIWFWSWPREESSWSAWSPEEPSENEMPPKPWWWCPAGCAIYTRWASSTETSNPKTCCTTIRDRTRDWSLQTLDSLVGRTRQRCHFKAEKKQLLWLRMQMLTL